MTNKQVEVAAIEVVMAYERLQGRVPRDSRHRGEAADLESSGRVIEVKAYGGSGRGYDLWLEVRQFEEAQRNPNFYLYVVEHVRSGKPTLKILHGEQLARLLGRAKEKRHFELPWPTRDYDATSLEILEPPNTIQD